MPNTEYIVSVTYDKNAGEFSVKRRNVITGEQSVTFANHLADDEKIFAKAGVFYEDRWIAQWTAPVI